MKGQKALLEGSRRRITLTSDWSGHSADAGKIIRFLNGSRQILITTVHDYYRAELVYMNLLVWECLLSDLEVNL